MIRSHFIPSLTGRSPPDDTERGLLALPPRLGGLGLVNPVCLGSSEHPASLKVSHPLSAGILNQHPQSMEQITNARLEAKPKVRADKCQRSNTTASNVKSCLTSTAQRSMELTQEKGASCWLTALPIEHFGFHPHKSDSHDALALRYHQMHQLTVPVGRGSHLNMLSLVQRGTLPQSGTMKLEI